MPACIGVGHTLEKSVNSPGVSQGVSCPINRGLKVEVGKGLFFSRVGGFQPLNIYFWLLEV